MTSRGDRHPGLRRAAWWFGVAPSLCFALVGIGLLRLPGLHGLPQQDRPYGWLTDRLAAGGGWAMLALAVLFGLMAIAMFFHARSTSAGG